MAALSRPDDSDGYLGPLLRERLVELIAADIADAVRHYSPGSVVVIDPKDPKPYAQFLFDAARDIWEELQHT